MRSKDQVQDTILTKIIAREEEAANRWKIQRTEESKLVTELLHCVDSCFESDVWDQGHRTPRHAEIRVQSKEAESTPYYPSRVLDMVCAELDRYGHRGYYRIKPPQGPREGHSLYLTDPMLERPRERETGGKRHTPYFLSPRRTEGRCQWR